MTDSQATWAPESCALPTAERPLREQEFAGLFRDELVSAALTAAGQADLLLNRGSRERAEELIARETHCCSFFGFTLTDEADALRVAIRVPEPYADVLAALVDGTEQAAGLRRS
ncbi:hypothetical protein [Microbacterium lushaniae]|uniref:Arsenate reductase n=1 Tax=Microbacterium lushaniae TaxID=2614639 RepID=A0A5J6L3C0_9MICO|nr:hypothetical protein [Microbacterium lushaniae]QEW03044.1 hypothetical protein F6J85_07965 [Microbacterium lushaniae]